MNPAVQHLIQLLWAAGISAIGWLAVYTPEPAPGFYVYLARRQRKDFVQFLRLAGRSLGVVFAAWTVIFFFLMIVDLVR